MKKITSINQLVSELDKCRGNQLGEMLKNITLSDNQITEIEKLCTWNEKFYTRNLINRTKDYELIFLCWESMQISPIHNHSGQQCWVKVLKGICEEKLYVIKDGMPQLIKTTVAEKNTNAYIDDDIALHSIQNVEKGRMITLHLYSNPIDNCLIFDKKTNQLRTIQTNYHHTISSPRDI